MASLAGLLLRVILSLSLALLPGAQALAMARAMTAAGEAPAAPCHGMHHGMDSQADAIAQVALDQSADSCCGTPQCHCLSALALPTLPRLIQARLAPGLGISGYPWLPTTPTSRPPRRRPEPDRHSVSPRPSSTGLNRDGPGVLPTRPGPRWAVERRSS